MLDHVIADIKILGGVCNIMAEFCESSHKVFKSCYRETSKRSFIAMRETLYCEEGIYTTDAWLDCLLKQKADGSEKLRYKSVALKAARERAMASDGAVLVHSAPHTRLNVLFLF